MSKHKLKLTAAITAILLCCGCMSIFRGGKQYAEVNSAPMNAVVKLNGEFAGITPLALELPRNERYEVSIELDGYQPHYIVIESRINGGWLFCSCLLGGIIGTIIDLATGSLYDLNKQQIEVILKPNASGGVIKRDLRFVIATKGSRFGGTRFIEVRSAE